ncbi:glycosyltransferase [Acidihalobacter ferrooxydans]|uniref:Glycosyltransferase 2-like domain-containing protein n=1 Tax=Acidihalobacter ferrooxydans TaxID=1765967 RepID=A0A1P8UJ30_9GAMM|nr:glycosyltransferase [Acidihalobacter ferrooxydans]APZ43814.1 hypothetical protein BW247_12545 [Acidihalobacter ferrooxydans]
MQPILSIVVPVYNVAPYLEQCLDSLIAQNLHGMELIIVDDDGSTDACPTILARYVDERPEIIVIRQENRGLSAARNTGLEHASGEYLAFVDSDDWIEPDYYRRLLHLARSNDLDIAHGNAVYDYEGRRAGHLMYNDNFPIDVMTGREVLRQRLADKSFLHMVCMHLYRRTYIENLHMRFVPNLIHEDILWTTRAFLEAHRVAYDPTPGYHYRRPLRAPLSDQRQRTVIESYIYIARGLVAMTDPLCDDPGLKMLLRQHMVDDTLTIFHRLTKIRSKAMRRGLYRKLRHDGVYTLLWHHAKATAHRRRIARTWLKSWLIWLA